MAEQIPEGYVKPESLFQGAGGLTYARVGGNLYQLGNYGAGTEYQGKPSVQNGYVQQNLLTTPYQGAGLGSAIRMQVLEAGGSESDVMRAIDAQHEAIRSGMTTSEVQAQKDYNYLASRVGAQQAQQLMGGGYTPQGNAQGYNYLASRIGASGAQEVLAGQRGAGYASSGIANQGGGMNYPTNTLQAMTGGQSQAQYNQPMAVPVSTPIKYEPYGIASYMGADVGIAQSNLALNESYRKSVGLPPIAQLYAEPLPTKQTDMGIASLASGATLYSSGKVLTSTGQESRLNLEQSRFLSTMPTFGAGASLLGGGVIAFSEAKPDYSQNLLEYEKNKPELTNYQKAILEYGAKLESNPLYSSAQATTNYIEGLKTQYKQNIPNIPILKDILGTQADIGSEFVLEAPSRLITTAGKGTIALVGRTVPIIQGNTEELQAQNEASLKAVHEWQKQFGQYEISPQGVKEISPITGEGVKQAIGFAITPAFMMGGLPKTTSEIGASSIPSTSGIPSPKAATQAGGYVFAEPASSSGAPIFNIKVISPQGKQTAVGNILFQDIPTSEATSGLKFRGAFTPEGESLPSPVSGRITPLTSEYLQFKTGTEMRPILIPQEAGIVKYTGAKPPDVIPMFPVDIKELSPDLQAFFAEKAYQKMGGAKELLPTGGVPLNRPYAAQVSFPLEESYLGTSYAPIQGGKSVSIIRDIGKTPEASTYVIDQTTRLPSGKETSSLYFGRIKQNAPIGEGGSGIAPELNPQGAEVYGGSGTTTIKLTKQQEASLMQQAISFAEAQKQKLTTPTEVLPPVVKNIPLAGGTVSLQQESQAKTSQKEIPSSNMASYQQSTQKQILFQPEGQATSNKPIFKPAYGLTEEVYQGQQNFQRPAQDILKPTALMVESGTDFLNLEKVSTFSGTEAGQSTSQLQKIMNPEIQKPTPNIVPNITRIITPPTPPSNPPPPIPTGRFPKLAPLKIDTGGRAGTFGGFGASKKKGKKPLVGILPDYISAMRSQLRFGKATKLPLLESQKYAKNLIGFSPTKEMVESKKQGVFKLPKFKARKRGFKKV